MAFRGSTPFRSAKKTTTTRQANVEDGPLRDFLEYMDETVPEEWQARTQALAGLIESIPREIVEDDDIMWYNDAKSIRMLHRPVSALLKDPRSSVVKLTCASLVQFYEKRPGVYGKLLFKELVPIVLDVHGQTVHTIRSAVQEMFITVLPRVPCKASMPSMMERLEQNKSKSRTVRQAAVLYLRLALECWKDAEENYLNHDVVLRVGTLFVKTLRDASLGVRQEAKLGIKVIHEQYPPECLQKLMEHSLVQKDVKLQKYLRSLANDEDDTTHLSFLEEASVASMATSRSRASYHRGAMSPVPHRGRRFSPSPGRRGNRNSPHRFGYSGRTSPSPQRNKTNYSSVPSSVVVGTTAAPTKTNKTSLLTKRSTNIGPPLRVANEINKVQHDNSPQQQRVVLNYGEEENIVTSPTPFVLGISELKKQAKSNRSRRSLLMEEKLRQSSMQNLLLEENNLQESSSTNLLLSNSSHHAKPQPQNGDDTPNKSPATTPVAADTPSFDTAVQSPPSTEPEHVLIAKQLHQAHQSHVDAIMDLIKVEMDALQDFDVLISSSGENISEEDVVTYFDCIGLCLDQRTASGRALQQELNKISGVPQQETGNS